MCGIVGYVGEREAMPMLLEGLEKLEYRGYDSAGIAVNNGENIQISKDRGKLAELKESLSKNQKSGFTGLGHTRWATHGKPSSLNSHPHQDCKGNIVVVHNGIIENYQKLKNNLKGKNHKFVSDTDTEVIAHLLEELYKGDMIEAIIQLTKRLEGSYALGIMVEEEPDTIYGVRQDSPLVVGENNNENFLASDIPAYLNYTDSFYILEDGEIAKIKKREINIFDENGKIQKRDKFVVDWDAEMAEKAGYDHYMLKEINEQPDSIRRVLAGRIEGSRINLAEIGFDKKKLKEFNKIKIVACGTAYHAGLVGEYLLEELVNMPVDVDIASEFRYRETLIDKNTLFIVVSQSGETADTLAALRLAQKQGVSVLALTNVVGSTIAREADKVFHLKAGPEIAVASTKAYINMISAFYLLALYLADINETISETLKKDMIRDIKRLPELTNEIIESSNEIVKNEADLFSEVENSFFIGRNIDYTLAMEGALKLKEISYIHAEAYPAGELKHGTLALVEEGIPVVAIASRNKIISKTLSNIKEVKARGARIIAVVPASNKKIADFKEDTLDTILEIPDIHELLRPLLAVIPLQLLSYYTALNRGCNIDQPRNLAKSVTVE